MPETVYGIGESKSKVQVYSTDETYNKNEAYSKDEVYNKNQTYNKLEATALFLKIQDGALKNHASANTSHGVGTSTLYGHVKLTTSTDAPSGSMDGVALAGSMGYTLKQYTDTKAAEVQNIAMLPVDSYVLYTRHIDVADFATLMGYGTWVYSGAVDVSRSASEQFVVYAFRRVS